jgi:hypothetical protein
MGDFVWAISTLTLSIEESPNIPNYDLVAIFWPEYSSKLAVVHKVNTWGPFITVILPFREKACT